jgi:hypothetical protein
MSQKGVEPISHPQWSDSCAEEGALTFGDARGTGDLTEFFSLGNPPRRFKAIKAPLSQATS